MSKYIRTLFSDNISCILSKIKKIHESLWNKTEEHMITLLPETRFTHKLLYCSSHLFLIPFLCYLFTEKTRIQSILFTALFSNFVFSIAFWYNPLKGSLIHQIDAIAARTSITLLLLYTTIFRNLSIFGFVCYVFIVFSMGLFFYLSNSFSRCKWCCKEHILCHFFAHIFACLAIFFTIL
jgi:hypothetical protein